MQYGEIIQLGEHRLMRGDATRYDDVIKLVGSDKINLVLTDPPYGVGSVDKRTGRIGADSKQYAECIGDINTDMAEENYKIVRALCNKLIIWGGQNFTRFLPPSCGWIFWDKLKNTENLSFGDGELAWSNISTKIKRYAFKWNGFVRDGDKKLNEKIHPNQKPVELLMKILEDFSHEGNYILDCFGGSGATLLAAELTGRKCLMMEISSDYCDAIINRYKILTERVINFESI